MRIALNIPLTMPDPGWRTVLRTFWESLGAGSMPGEIKEVLCWAALGLSVGVVGTPADHGLDLRRYAVHVRAELEAMGARPGVDLIAHAFSLAVFGLEPVEAPSAPAQVPNDGPPPEPPAGAPVETIMAYHRSLDEYNARRRG